MTVNKKWDLTGVHGVNKYLWSKLESELEWSKTNYGGLMPIIPASQQPELNDYSAPYIVYNYSHQSSGDFYIQEEQIAYAIYSSNEADIRRAINVIVAYFQREDESAQAINDYLKGYRKFNGPDDKDGTWVEGLGTTENKRFDYKHTKVLSTYGAQPPVSEGGRQDGSVIIRIRYTYYDPSTGTERLGI